MPINTNNSSLIMSAGLVSQFPGGILPQVAFSGRSNVGKSSLINSLLGRKALARVSSSPGKTITVNFYEIDGKLIFADLPGYGFAKRPDCDKKRWSALTDGYFTGNKNIDRLKLVVQLIDCKVGFTSDDLTMIDWLAASGMPYVIAATKIDKLGTGERTRQLEAIASHPDVVGHAVIPVSSKTGTGKRELWATISDYCLK